VKALLESGFEVTAVTRESSAATFPDGVEVRRADLSSIESLTEAFNGQDAVVVTIATSEVDKQNTLIDAAVAAGVKRFIPSEFGHNSKKLSGGLATILSLKAQTAKYLDETAKANPEFTWTGIATSPFFDWGLDNGLWGINLKDKTANIIDSGNELVSTSTLAFVAKSIVAVLQNEADTANQLIDVVEFNVSQNEVLHIIEEETGAKFKLSHANGSLLGLTGEDKLTKGDVWGAFIPLLLAWNFSDGGNHALKREELANERLGLKGVDVREAVQEYIKVRSL